MMGEEWCTRCKFAGVKRDQAPCATCYCLKDLPNWTLNQPAAIITEELCKHCRYYARPTYKPPCNHCNLGGDGSHFVPANPPTAAIITADLATEPTDRDRAMALASPHWGFVRQLLEAGDVTVTELHARLYVEAFVHGYKHGGGAGNDAQR